ncbi:hypothetical protein SAMN06265337_2118 [Hymenobacter gelipurpurascens]|uniref:SdiA-regulated n=1 Tax=Hymenobacter gelipurpurascens TaxID=89968 RepID=A0A212TQ18_9BACT|nr:hypothetical protein [Hymenobacter gelipurpurascens]SNC67924.1 hypothetical protein SAMN06265337_2118 [Hymenobacter gelipurpurascens]
MRVVFFAALFAGSLLSGSCSEARTEDKPESKEKTGKKKGKKSKAKADIVNMNQVGTLDQVPESSGLALSGQPGSFYTHGDDGNQPILYKVDDKGKLLEEIPVQTKSNDWESITRDNSGNLYIGDVGNNNNDRQNLVIHRLRPEAPNKVDDIRLKYPDQKAFPPSKKERNFDCEATLWHNGQIYLFTKDRALESTSKVYTVPDRPGSYTAKLLTKLAIPGQVTDAALSPDGRRLVLLARQEMFVLQGANLAELLKATPERISLAGAGQTEGAVFTDNNTLYISSEQGSLYEYEF